MEFATELGSTHLLDGASRYRVVVSVSTEQGNVQPWRERPDVVKLIRDLADATEKRPGKMVECSSAALRSWADALTTQIEERDEERERFHRHVETMIEPQLLARAEKAERALAEMDGALRGLWELDEFRRRGREVNPEWELAIVQATNAALFEDTSDE